jgi:hypothetical protein
MSSKLIFLYQLTCNLMLQVIRNFKVEYNYEMKFEDKLLHTPASPLKFKMIDRQY